MSHTISHFWLLLQGFGLDIKYIVPGRDFSLPEQPETQKMGKYKNLKLPETPNQNPRVPEKYFKLGIFGIFETFLSF